MILTVGITSYNRPVELRRCLESIGPIDDKIEILVSEDFSPKRLEIIETIKNFEREFGTKVRLKLNEQNLGYDRNLHSIFFEASGEYVLLLSDDDCLEPHAVQFLLKAINEVDLAVGYLRFSSPTGAQKKRFQRHSGSTEKFQGDLFLQNGSMIYQAILFSGLVFRRDEVLRYDFSKWFSSIYIQVAMFVALGKAHGIYCISGPGIVIFGDGENGFGLNEAGGEDADLADRESIFANLTYQRRLLKAIRDIDDHIYSGVFSIFIAEYKRRSVSGMMRARVSGLSSYLVFIREYFSTIEARGVLPAIYAICIFFVPAVLARFIVRFYSRLIAE